MTGVEYLLVVVCVLLAVCLLPVALVAIATVLLYGAGACLIIGSFIADAWGGFREWLAR